MMTRPVEGSRVSRRVGGGQRAGRVRSSRRASRGRGKTPFMTAALFLVTWLMMMVAMMFPSVAPMTLAFASFTRSRGEGYLPAALFVLGYIAVWTVSGLVPLAVQQAVTQIWMTPPSWLPRASGAVVLLAGVYQL